MPDNIAIAVRNISKRYFVYENQRARLKHAFWTRHTDGVAETWALRDISFEVKKGESVGIIGRNGSGKSTLLEIITGTLKPTAGSVQVNGRVAALLELGSGFNPEYTGRENVFLNGLLLGLSRPEVEARFDDIAGFADIGDVLDRSVKTYSSGMLVRLAFAVQVALDPDILIVDEALSVGDYFFQQKCFGRLRKMREDGLTLLFVSHDMGSVRSLCSQAVYLRKGVAIYSGEAVTAIRHYFAEGSESTLPTETGRTSSIAALPAPIIKGLPADALWKSPAQKHICLLAVRISNMDGQAVDNIELGDKANLDIYFSNTEVANATIAIALKNRYDQIVFATNSQRLGVPPCVSNPQTLNILSMSIIFNLEAGQYTFRVVLNRPMGGNTSEELDTTEWIGPLNITWDYENKTAPFLGMFGIPVTAKIIMTKGTIL
jgi:lipopolysaccharide transport system ATP-binding protein